MDQYTFQQLQEIVHHYEGYLSNTDRNKVRALLGSIQSNWASMEALQSENNALQYKQVEQFSSLRNNTSAYDDQTQKTIKHNHELIYALSIHLKRATSSILQIIENNMQGENTMADWSPSACYPSGAYETVQEEEVRPTGVHTPSFYVPEYSMPSHPRSASLPSQRKMEESPFEAQSMGRFPVSYRNRSMSNPPPPVQQHYYPMNTSAPVPLQPVDRSNDGQWNGPSPSINPVPHEKPYSSSYAMIPPHPQSESMSHTSKSSDSKSDEEIDNKSSKWKTQLCVFYMHNQCTKTKEECPFAHGASDLRDGKDKYFINHPKYKTSLCHYYLNGSCMFDACRCKFAHGIEDLRK